MLENIEIIDYKCFKNLELESLGQINIISGDNNVGKTALLEALFIERDLNHVKYGIAEAAVDYISLLGKNRNINSANFDRYLKEFKYKIHSQDATINFSIKYGLYLSDKEKALVKKLNEKTRGYFLICEINDELDIISLKNAEFYDNEDFENNYINSSKPTNEMLVNLYSEIQTQGIQHNFLEYLQILDKNIVWIEPQLLKEEAVLRVNLKDPNISLITSELGEGINRYIEILCTLLSNSEFSVFIDEIENGIHYSRLKDIWKAIIQIVQAEDIQLFVTTHDKETIEALKEASDETNYKDITSIKLSRDKENKIVPTIHKYDNFVYGIERGADLR